MAGSADRYVVALERGVRIDSAATLLLDHDAAPQPRRLAAFPALDAFAADLTPDEVKQLRRSKNIRYVEPVAPRYILGFERRPATDVDRNLEGQTVPPGVDLIHAREVWRVTRGSLVNVAVIDTGVDYSHPDLLDTYAGGFNAFTESNNAMDEHGHGTHVAGTIAANDNDLGVVGVAPLVRLWAVKALLSDGSGSSDRVIAGINWVIERKRQLGGNWIINLSIGSPESNVAEGEAVARAISEGILVVAASGNNSTESNKMPVSYPAAYPGVLAVGAVDDALRLAAFSNQGPQLAAVAPGVDVLSTVRVGSTLLSRIVGDTGTFDGTALEGSPKGVVSGIAVYCGIGRAGDFPPAVNGNIAVIRRSAEMTFSEKTRRAKAAGATAVLIVDYKESTTSQFSLYDGGEPDAGTFDWPVTIALKNKDGEPLIAAWNATVTITNRTDDYLLKTGTSMAAPYVAGAAALAWAVAPGARANDILHALTSTATDLGPAGNDFAYGHGIVNALAAATKMNPGAFGAPLPQPSGRRVLRRGR